MNIGLILAGGLGVRMGQSSVLPKQFFELADKPILIHTLEIFERHPDIDAVCVVYLPTWEGYLEECLKAYGIKKVKWMVPGGYVRQLSVFNGLEELEKHCPEDTIVLVHDGVRPFINKEVITNNINMVKEKGNAMTATRCTDTLVSSPDGSGADAAMDRDNTFSVQTPQSYPLSYGLQLYRKAYELDMKFTINCCELFVALGETVHLVTGTRNNMKLTTEEDIAFLQAMHKIYRHDL